MDKFALWTGGLLHGSNVFMGRNPAGGPGGFGDGAFASADFQDLAVAGANYVHISAAGLFAERPPYALDVAAQASLDDVVDKVGRVGLYAVIAIRSGPGRGENALTGRGLPTLYEPIWTDQAAQDMWVRMMGYLANRYRSSPTVVGYDPLVEPNNAARLSATSPGKFYASYGASIQDVNPLYARVTAAVRQADPATPILVEPEDYGSVDWLPYLKITGDRRTVYTVHDYEPMDYTHEQKPGLTYPGNYELPADTRPQFVDSAAINTRMQIVRDYAYRNHVPVAVTEFGVHHTAHNAAAYLSDRIRIHNRLGSWAVWTWQPAGFDDPFNMHDASAVHDLLVHTWHSNCTRPPR